MILVENLAKKVLPSVPNAILKYIYKREFAVEFGTAKKSLVTYPPT
jgi:hypothetical protein